MATRPIVRGPVAERVSRNVRQLRTELRIGLPDLAKRLTTIGRPTTVSVLSKLELGERRVDVDELVALALALEVNPNRLLLDPDADDGAEHLTAEFHTTKADAWSWAVGEEQIFEPEWFHDRNDLEAHETWFEQQCRPHSPPAEYTITDMARLEPVLGPLVQVAHSAMDAGMRQADVVHYIRLMTQDRDRHGDRATLETIDIHIDGEPHAVTAVSLKPKRNRHKVTKPDKK